MQHPAHCKSFTRLGIFRIRHHPARGNVKFPRSRKPSRHGLSALLIDIKVGLAQPLLDHGSYPKGSP